jgi:hypothetical protein
MEKSGGVFAEGEDAKGDEFELCICGCGGVCAERGREADQVLAGAPGVLGDLEEDLMDEGGGQVGEG